MQIYCAGLRTSATFGESWYRLLRNGKYTEVSGTSRHGWPTSSARSRRLGSEWEKAMSASALSAREKEVLYVLREKLRPPRQVAGRELPRCDPILNCADAYAEHLGDIPDAVHRSKREIFYCENLLQKTKTSTRIVCDCIHADCSCDNASQLSEDSTIRQSHRPRRYNVPFSSTVTRDGWQRNVARNFERDNRLHAVPMFTGGP
jgi:hypothetical protein